ncbi:hypothetical protein HPB50_014550 [Hyalomma asiaticum]|uniref:Uncharacterized protein n=1 Tax=Hyalomma asiaticum TaxID=266040 RepID=A0ACB7RQY9_HYAAI|nr:hypothetical protein HPB50_014550 [Hyalomma asiaticum]
MRHDWSVSGWQMLQHRRTVARVNFLCRCLDGSLGDAYICATVRCNKRTGQPEAICEDCAPPELSHSSSSARLSSAPLKGQTTIHVVAAGQIKFTGKRWVPYSESFVLTAEGNVWRIVMDTFRFQEPAPV